MRNSFETETSQPILMIDDDVKLCRLVKDYLAPFGFNIEAVHTGTEGLERIRQTDFRAVILDLMLPGIDGISVLRQLRTFSNIPVLMLTALGDESDRIVGLEVGADDYLPKTFSTRELLARLRAVTRRSQITEMQTKDVADEIIVNDISINSATREVTQNGELINLTALEFDLLLCLARSAGRVLDRDKLLDEIAGREYDVFDRSVDVHISILRRKLGDDPKNPRYIKTIRSVGYMLTPEVED
ncbi:MAG TPA: response regulator transcription factor [Pyrinomonadaceae bacterium]|jgi:two-component system response regulator CpxR